MVTERVTRSLEGDELLTHLRQSAPEFAEKASYLMNIGKGFNCHGAVAFLLGFTNELRELWPGFILESVKKNGLNFNRRPNGTFVILPHNGYSPDHSGIGLNGSAEYLAWLPTEVIRVMDSRRKVLVLHKTDKLKLSTLGTSYFRGGDLDFYELSRLRI